jgi:hypothetical protein
MSDLLQWCQQCQAATTSWIDVWGVVHCTGCDPQDAYDDG